MKFFFTAFLALAHLLAATPVYIGTGADGIYLADFDEEKGILSEPSLAVKYDSPGFLTLHPKLPVLHCVGRDHTVASFQIGKNHSLNLLGNLKTSGQGPCHLTIDSSGRGLAVALYGSGAVASIRLDPTGKPIEIATSESLKGSGPHPERQTTSHAHGVYFDKNSNYLFVPDLGIDRVIIRKYDTKTSTFSSQGAEDFVSAPGSGPRHMAFSPDEEHAYIINELTNTITVASFDSSKGSLQVIQEMPTLPQGYSQPNTTAEIEVHSNGNFVYGSNRGHDSIAVYRRDPATGKLTFLQHASCGGKTPRHFKISPSGKWLLCGHQATDTISVLSLNPETGILGQPISTVSSPKPICILFPNP